MVHAADIPKGNATDKDASLRANASIHSLGDGQREITTVRKRKLPCTTGNLIGTPMFGLPEGVQKALRDLTSQEALDYERVITPLVSQFILVGLRDVTITLVKYYIKKVLILRGVSGVAEMISDWNVCTRHILSDERWTREANPVPGVLHAKTARNSRLLYSMVDRPCREIRDSTFSRIEIHQGERPIPPFLLDRICLPGMLPNPTLDNKSVLVHLSNLKRTLPEGDGQKILNALHKFRDDVEAVKPLFVLRNIACQLNQIYGKTSSGRKSRIDISFHGSLEYARSKDGKVREFMTKVVNLFTLQPLHELFPIPPPANLYDFTGNLVLRPEDWSEDVPLWKVLYPEISTAESNMDNRLGHLSLLWALAEIRKEEFVVIYVKDEFFESGCSTDPVAEVRFVRGSIRARVSPQPEEGFKVRVITLVSLAVSFIGAAARHLLDEHLWSNPEIKIGLLSRVKLYTLLDHIGGPKTSDPVRRLYNCTPLWAESVDLTAATNTPPTEHCADVLHGHIDGMGHPAEIFLRFAVDLATCERQFKLDSRMAGPIPAVHRCGLMMGEGLSGIFLNDSSALIRSLASPFAKRFPVLRGRKTMTKDEVNTFIRDHHYEIQGFLDTVELAPNRSGSQSGDDVVNFSNESLSASFRVLYVIWGFEPSESTWFTSECYATFTEEAALNTWDSNGWKFVDSIKPRAFSLTGGDPEGKILVSRMKLIGSYVRYFEQSDPKRQRAIDIAESMVYSHQAWKRVIEKNDIPIGWPEFLGGIEHPVGLNDNYKLTLSDQNLSILKGISKLDTLSAYQILYQTPDDVENTALSEIERMVRDMIVKLSEFPILDSYVSGVDNFLFDISEILPPQPVWWKSRDERSKFCKDNQLVTLPNFVDQFVSRMKLKAVLIGDERPPTKKSWTMAKHRIRKLRAEFPVETFRPSLEEIEDLTIWKIRESVMNKANAIAIPKSMMDDLIKDIALPHMDLLFHNGR